MSNQTDWYRVRLELKRIQTWLFLVPKLKTIVGANSLLGEFLRIKCPDLSRSAQLSPDACAVLQQAGAPGPLDGDPLAEDSGTRQGVTNIDDPARLYGAGLLARDGGHFQALYESNERALEAGRDIAGALADELPGIAYEVTVERWARESQEPCWIQIERFEGAATVLLHPPSVPSCSWSGDGVATESIRVARHDYPVSRRVKQQWDKGLSWIEDGGDVASTLARLGRLPLMHLQPPADIADLAGGKGRYVAVIHADGNNIGKRSTAARRLPKSLSSFEEWLAAEARGEVFFHRMRVAVRKALVEAIRETFTETEFRSGPRPYQVLMVGGDDLLLMCRASHALRFALAYAKALALAEREEERLGVGVGVSIGPATYPFHAMHDIAEELASSAKRIARRANAPSGESVVDWMVVSQSSTLSVGLHRQRFESRRYTDPGSNDPIHLALTAKPYPILRRDGSDWSLERLLEAAGAIRDLDNSAEPVARSQMKALPAKLRCGFHAARFAALDLPEGMLSCLHNALPSEFDKAHACHFPWRELDPRGDVKRYRTLLRDLFEILEIPNLGGGRGGQALPVGSGSPGTGAVADLESAA